MRQEAREASPQEYGSEQFKAQLETHLKGNLTVLQHELRTLDEVDEHILETGAQRVIFERDKGGDKAASEEIENSAEGFLERELKREEIQKKIKAIERILAKLSK